VRIDQLRAVGVQLSALERRKAVAVRAAWSERRLGRAPSWQSAVLAERRLGSATAHHLCIPPGSTLTLILTLTLTLTLPLTLTHHPHSHPWGYHCWLWVARRTLEVRPG